LEILDISRVPIDSETVTFSGMVLGEPFFVPLKLIIDIFPDSTEAPTNVRIELIGNQEIENIVIDWGDGSAPVPGQLNNNNHTYRENGNFIISVAATSRESQERATFTRDLVLAAPPPPPPPDAIIFDVRRVSSPDPPVAPAMINYTLQLNPDLRTRVNKFRILWTDFDKQIRDITIDGSQSIGLSETFIFENPGTEQVQVTIDLMDQENILLKSESRLFTEEILAVTPPEVPDEEPIVEPPIEEPTEPIDIPIIRDPFLPPEEPEEAPIEITTKTRNFIVLGIALASAGGVALAATR